MNYPEYIPGRIQEFLLDRRAARIAKTVVRNVAAGEQSFFVNDRLFSPYPRHYDPEIYTAVANKLQPHNIAIQAR